VVSAKALAVPGSVVAEEEAVSAAETASSVGFKPGSAYGGSCYSNLGNGAGRLANGTHYEPYLLWPACCSAAHPGSASAYLSSSS
jgi:hypothetical protein